jgi:hypothetical protein
VPASYQIDKARRLIISTAVGFLTGAEILAHQQQLQRDPDFNPDCSQIFDCTGVTGNSLSADDIKAIATKTIFSARSRRAVVVATDDQFGLARMFEILREGQGEYGIRVFRDQERAFQWAVPEGQAPPGVLATPGK